MPFALDFNTGGGGSFNRLVWFDDRIFAFVYATAAASRGCWRQVAIGNWNQVQVGTGMGAMWDERLFQGVNNNVINSSANGVAWALDFTNLGMQPNYTQWLAMGGDGDYFYAVNGELTAGVATYHFYRRDTLGAWVKLATTFSEPSPPNPAPSTQWGDVVGFGDYIYWSAGINVRRYSTAGGWEDEPQLSPGGWGCEFAVRGNVLYATQERIGLWYKTAASTNWAYSKLALAEPTNYQIYAPTLGADGYLYVTAINTTTGYARIIQGPLPWRTVYIGDIGAGASEHASIMTDAGEIFVGSHTGNVRFWRIVEDFNVVAGGLFPRAMDCDGDGTDLYLAVYDNVGLPLLLRVALPLSDDPVASTLYEPGAGDAINVKCSAMGGKYAISGYFGNNEQVRSSEDGGVPADVDPGTWGANRAQPLWLDPDGVENIMVCLDAAQDIVETEDSGANWTTHNAAVGYSPGALARLPDGEEIVIGDDAANSIEYSPNRGVTLQDITGAFVGNCQALEVV